jgi:hypothetical protein
MPSPSIRHIEPLLLAAGGGSALSQTVTDTLGLTDRGSEVTDDFTGTTGSALNSTKWTTSASSGNSVLINANRARHSFNGSGTTSQSTVSVVGKDIDILFNFQFSDTASQYRLEIDWRTTGASGSDQYYMVAENQSASTSYIHRVQSGVDTAIVTGLSLGGSTAKRWVRIHHVGANIKVRWWDDGSTEPGTWNVDYTDASPVLQSGVIALDTWAGGTNGGAAHTCDIDDFDAYEIAPSARITTGGGSAFNQTVTDIIYGYDEQTKFSDDFVLADGSLPDPNLWDSTNSPDILSQSLHLAYTDLVGASVTSLRKARDGELLFRHRFATNGVPARTEVWFRDAADGTSYALYIRGDSTTVDLKQNPSWVTLGSLTISANDQQWRWFRVQWIGTAIKVRQWLEGTTEPGTWTISATVAEPRCVGYVHAVTYLNTGTGSYAQYLDDVLLVDLSASGPTATITTGGQTLTGSASDSISIGDGGSFTDITDNFTDPLGTADSSSPVLTSGSNLVSVTIQRVLSTHTG